MLPPVHQAQPFVAADDDQGPTSRAEQAVLIPVPPPPPPVGPAEPAELTRLLRVLRQLLQHRQVILAGGAQRHLIIHAHIMPAPAPGSAPAAVGRPPVGGSS